GHRRHAQPTETETRLVNYVWREDVSVSDRVEILNDVERATGSGQLRHAVAETGEVVVGLESRIAGKEILRADRVLVVQTPIEVCVELVLSETRETRDRRQTARCCRRRNQKLTVRQTRVEHVNDDGIDRRDGKIERRSQARGRTIVVG